MMTARKEHVLGILAHGFSERDRNTLQMVFSGPAANRCRLADSGAGADICLFNFDCANASAQWTAFRAGHPDLPTIVLSLNSDVPADTTFLRKPLKSAELLAAIEQLRRQVPQRKSKPALKFVPKTNPDTLTKSAKSAAAITTGYFERDIFGFEPDVDLTSREEIARVSYDPQSTYQSIVSETIRMTLEDKCPRVIEGLLQRLESIVVTPEQGGRVLTVLSDNILRNLCSVGAANQKVSVHKCVVDELPLAAMTSTPAGAFLWKIALWSSRGRLPEGIDVHLPLRLRHWPNFTRLLLTPDALRIAALMTARDVSLAEVARTLGLSQRCVFTFFSAANATIGFETSARSAPLAASSMGARSPSAQHAAKASIGNNSHRGFLSRVLGRLMRNE